MTEPTIHVVHEACTEGHRICTSSEMPVSAASLYAWHEREEAFAQLRPPWQKMRVLSNIRKGGGLDVGTEVTVDLKVGPIWTRWVARHTACIPGQMFADEQVSGPFALFRHTHRMIALSDNSSRLEDDIVYRLPLEPLSLVALSFIRADLERGFRYRHEQTYRALSHAP